MMIMLITGFSFSLLFIAVISVISLICARCSSDTNCMKGQVT